VGGALCIFAFASEGSFNVSGERVLFVVFGVAFLALGGGYVFPQLFVIRKFPKYPKLRRIMLNSDIYFTDSTSNEYLGESRTLRGRRNKAAFEIVTAVAEAEKRMGNKKPVRYTVYMVFSILFSVIGLAWLFGALLLFDKGAIFPNMSDEVFFICWLVGAIVCIALASFFLNRAFNVALTAPFENFEWTPKLYASLADIAVRKSKKQKFLYNIDQLELIKKTVKSVSENAELRLETQGNKIVSFTVVDTQNYRVRFTGYFL
ncbi:MAG: hypothetical protein IKU45_06065, partial [Clostridia bacterium]|nr:hypothetical protein [Clostridia bacterium]